MGVLGTLECYERAGQGPNSLGLFTLGDAIAISIVHCNINS